MHPLPSGIDTHTFSDYSVPERMRRELEPQEIDALVYGTRQPSDDENELIEMRYQQHLAHMIMEELFSEAQMHSDAAAA